MYESAKSPSSTRLLFHVLFYNSFIFACPLQTLPFCASGMEQSVWFSPRAAPDTATHLRVDVKHLMPPRNLVCGMALRMEEEFAMIVLIQS
jgi:hypothetical protein